MADPIQASTEHVGNPRGQVILIVCIACGVLETVAVALQFLARKRLGARWRSDDWLILAALIPNYVMIVLGGFCKSHLGSTVESLILLWSVVGEGKADMHKSAVSEAGMVMFLKVRGILDSLLPFSALTQLDAFRIDDYLHFHHNLSSTIHPYATAAYIRNHLLPDCHCGAERGMRCVGHIP